MQNIRYYTSLFEDKFSNYDHMDILTIGHELSLYDLNLRTSEIKVWHIFECYGLINPKNTRIRL